MLARVVMAFSPRVSLSDYTAGLYYSPTVLTEGKLMRHYRWYLLQRKKSPPTTAAESIDNHSGILIFPPDILFAESGPWRGLRPKRARTIIESTKDHTQGLILM